jgi:RNA recognition motif-containing protein
VEEKDLMEYFTRYAGVKSAEVIRDKEGNSRGFAYVVLDSQDAADKVCSEYFSVSLRTASQLNI